jgi:CheY-like chemotaxis protein
MIKRCCILVSKDVGDREVFMRASYDVVPETICLSVSTAIEALYLVTIEKVVPDFILMDHHTYPMNAVEFLDTIRKTGSLGKIPVIVHSISPEKTVLAEIKKAGAAAIYAKPFEYWGLCNLLNLFFSDQTTVFNQN